MRSHAVILLCRINRCCLAASFLLKTLVSSASLFLLFLPFLLLHLRYPYLISSVKSAFAAALTDTPYPNHSSLEYLISWLIVNNSTPYFSLSSIIVDSLAPYIRFRTFCYLKHTSVAWVLGNQKVSFLMYSSTIGDRQKQLELFLVLP